MKSLNFGKYGLLLVACLFSMPVWAQVEAGRILFARGAVSIVGEGDSARGAQAGSAFYEGERVVTGNRSIAQFRLSDGALTALRSNSDYHIIKQRFSEDDDALEQAGRLLTGWMRSVTGAIGARSPARVSQGTSVATIGIRGTVYQVIHVPEEGLPEFPNLQPGSYIYLEEGSIEISNEAGSRVVNPGQVVRVAGADVAPELSPDLLELFQSDAVAGLAGAGDDNFSIRDLLDEGRDQLVEEGLDDFKGGPFSGTVSGVGAFGGSYIGTERVPGNLIVAGEGADRHPVAMQVGNDESAYWLSANEGAVPATGLGYLVLGQSGVASQVLWGKWAESDIQVSEGISEPFEFSGPVGYWHYMIADNVIENPLNLGEIGPVGRYRYNFAGGLPLTEFIDGTVGTGSLSLISSSHIMVDFASLIADVDLSFDNDARLTGSGSMEDFYTWGISLESTSQANPAFGAITGQAVGENAEGIISALWLNSNGSDYFGTAAFQREFAPTITFGGVAAIDTSISGQLVATAPPWGVVMGESGNDKFPTAMVLPGPSVDSFAVVGLNASPDQVFSKDVYTVPGDTGSPVATEVYWGIWSAAGEPPGFSVTETSFGNTGDIQGDWHYMVASNPMSVDALLENGPTGFFVYDYIDGTLLTSSAGDTVGILSSSYVEVDFTNLFDFNSIYVSLDMTDGVSLEGSGNIDGLYDFGIFLNDVNEGEASGNFVGAFAGSDAEALVSAINYNDGADTYQGTALFERESLLGEEPGIGQ